MSSIEQRLCDLGLIIPVPKPPAGNYFPWRRCGDHIFVSGQLSAGPDGDANGRCGDPGIDVLAGQNAARLCGLNLLGQMLDATGGALDNINAIVKVCGFVRVVEGFTDLPVVLDGCSDLLVAVFGQRGRHARSVVGVSELPRGCLVEIDAVIALT